MSPRPQNPWRQVGRLFSCQASEQSEFTRGQTSEEPALHVCTPGAGSASSGPDMKQRNRVPAARREAGLRDPGCLDRGQIREGRDAFSPGAFPRNPTLASFALSLPQDTLLPSPASGRVEFEDHLLPLRWMQWGGGPLSSHSCCPSPQAPSLSLSLSVTRTHTHSPTLSVVSERSWVRRATRKLRSPDLLFPISQGKL